MKKNKKTMQKVVISLIFVLGITCIISVAYNLLGGFYFSRIVKYNTMLGEDLVVKINDDGVWSGSCNFSGSLILGENFSQKVQLEVGEIKEPLYVRAKALVSGTSVSVDMSGTTNWIKSSDGYYYLNQQISAYNNLQLCNNLIFKSNMNLDGKKDYILTFLIQTSRYEWNFEEII